MTSKPGDNNDRWIEEVRSKIEIAAEGLDRGESVDGETAIAQIRARLHKINDIDDRDTWTEEDISDLTAFSLQYAETIYPDSDDSIA